MRKEFADGMNTKKMRKGFRDRENLLFAIWFLWMAVYYAFRMFILTPWYDELYTYYYFISRGPVYAAIHWPLPNNHVGYSVLSGILDWFGNSYIGLRGISYLGALANLLLLYCIGRRHLKSGWSFCCVALYSCMNLVNQLAVQGRGYTLATTCYLAALFMLQKIIFGQEKETRADMKYYVVFSLSLTFGLYVLPSSVYWVLPICVIGGLFLLLYRKKSKLLHLIAASMVAAVNTVMLYAMIWLAIGSNLLSKAEESPYFGQRHVSIILSAPFWAVKTGMDYMLSTPYIQSVAREGYATAFAIWLRSLMDYYYSHTGFFLAGILLIGSMEMAVWGRKAYREGKKEQVFFSIFLAGMILLTPVILVIQCKLPYFRVFSYMGIPIALLCGAWLQKIGDVWAKWMKRMQEERIGKGVVVFILLAIVLLVSKDYNSEYGTTEYYAKDALAHADVQEKGTLCVTDCYQQYLLKFCYDIECENRQVENADLVLIHREMEWSERENFRWEFYQSYESIPWDYIDGMNPVYENKEYTVYVK